MKSRRRAARVMRSDAGMATAEFAIVLIALAFVVQLLIAGISIVTVHLQVVDAAHMGARLAARGESMTTVEHAMTAIAPRVTVQVDRSDGTVRVTAVETPTSWLAQKIVRTLSSTGVAVDESTVANGGAAP